MPFTGWEASPGPLSFCTSCSWCQGKVCRPARPASVRVSPRARAAPGWAHRPATRRAVRGGQPAPVSLALLEMPTAGPPAWVPRGSPGPGARRACYEEDRQRNICTWGCDNTSVDFFFFTSHLRCLQSEFYYYFFFVIPLSLLKGECVFLWEE